MKRETLIIIAKYAMEAVANCEQIVKQCSTLQNDKSLGEDAKAYFKNKESEYRTHIYEINNHIAQLWDNLSNE